MIETIERWQFDVDTNDKAKENIANYSVQKSKNNKRNSCYSTNYIVLLPFYHY